jgi:hypothetical protein
MAPPLAGPVEALAGFAAFGAAFVASAFVPGLVPVCAWAAGGNISNAKAGSRHRMSAPPIRRQILVERTALATAIGIADMMDAPHFGA